jgi:release factor glutamine methyltransferase
VASNPPYVPDDAIPRDPEVRLFDPPAALYGGPDGLDAVRVLSRVGLRLAHPGGTIVIEHGEWQGSAIREILATDGWRAAATHPDLTTRDRATTAIRP